MMKQNKNYTSSWKLNNTLLPMDYRSNQGRNKFVELSDNNRSYGAQ